VNLDTSVAPEIAQLMGFMAPGPAGPQPAPAAVPTVGELARQLRLITGAPERWWHLARFDPDRAVRVSIPAGGPAEMRLMIIPPAGPGAQVHGAWTLDGGECGCEVVTVVAGEVTERAIGDCGVATSPLLPGKIRVHGSGQLHEVSNRGGGYTVSLHARAPR